MRDDVDGEEAMVPRVPNLPLESSARQIAEHEFTGHAVYRSCCRHCVVSKGRAHAHSSREEGELPEIGIDCVTGVELVVLMTSPEGDHQANGLAEVGVREIKAQTRILRSQLEQRLGSRIDEKDPLMSWIPRHAANCVSRY